MKQTTTVMKNPITADNLHNFITVENQISNALERLGYDLDNHELSLRQIAFERYRVNIDGQYFGIWDSRRCTFVD